MAFRTKKVKSKTLGEYLRHCREHSGFALPDIVGLSRVQAKFILALEEGRYKDLPDQVYVKGFLKSLGAVYHVPFEMVYAQYQDEQEIAKNIEKAKTQSLPKFLAPKFIFSPKTVLIGSLAALGILSVTYLYFQISSLRRPPHLELFSPTSDQAVNSAVLLIKGRTEGGASVYLNNQAIVVDAKGQFGENLSLAPGSNFLTIKSVNKFGQETTVTRSINYQEKEIAGAATGTPETVLPSELTLEVSMGDEAAWIYLEADGIEKYAGTMLANSTQKVVAHEKVVLTTGNAGTTRVKLNGKDLGILGKEGEVLRDIEFTPTR